MYFLHTYKLNASVILKVSLPPMSLLSLTVKKFCSRSTYGKPFTYIARLGHVYEGEETVVLDFQLYL